jgi:hypothetical protein
MANWDQIRQEIAGIKKPDAHDIVRRQKIDQVQKLTGRHLIIYAVDFISPNPFKSQTVGNLITISLADKDGFDEVTRNLKDREKGLDVLLQSPGGSAEATESIVELLRDRFSDIRFIIPNTAKSAATMLAMSGNQILMDERSELGPIDPQRIFVRDNRVIVAPVQAIKDQFDKAQQEITRDPSKLPSWMPILRELSPSLLAECDKHMALAELLVSKWLAKYMFKGEEGSEEKAKDIAEYLNSHNNFYSHGRRIGIDELKAKQVKVIDMRDNPPLQEAVRDLYVAIMLTFEQTGAFRIFENGQKEAMIAQVQQHFIGPGGKPFEPIPPSQPIRQPPSYTRPPKK